MDTVNKRKRLPSQFSGILFKHSDKAGFCCSRNHQLPCCRLGSSRCPHHLVVAAFSVEAKRVSQCSCASHSPISWVKQGSWGSLLGFAHLVSMGTDPWQYRIRRQHKVMEGQIYTSAKITGLHTWQMELNFQLTDMLSDECVVKKGLVTTSFVLNSCPQIGVRIKQNTQTWFSYVILHWYPFHALELTVPFTSFIQLSTLQFLPSAPFCMALVTEAVIESALDKGSTKVNWVRLGVGG